MAAKKYLVPMDFSKRSVVALHHAAGLAGSERGSSLLLLHVITESAARVPFYLRKEFYGELEKSAAARMKALLRRKKPRLPKCTTLIVSAADPARAIAAQARKSRVSMIVMASHGRSGLKRLVLGSVAERTLRYARCPVLIVKP